MGSFRVARKSVIFSLRAKKRLIVFVIIFGILSGATLLLVGTFDSYNKENLLDQRGVYITENGDYNITQPQLNNLLQNIDNSKFSIHTVRYFDYSNPPQSGMRVVGIDHNSPWAFSEVKKNSIKSGRFIDGSNDAMISDHFTIPLNWFETGSNVSASLKVGNSITFRGTEDPMTFKITGIFSESARINPPWLIVSNDIFDDLASHLSKDNLTDIFCFQVAFVAKGGILAVLIGDTYTRVHNLAGELNTLKSSPGNYGSWSISVTSRDEKIEERDQDLLSFAFGVFGGLIVASLYAYLITRFRRREVAILKAIGFNAKNVRITLLCEILTVAFLGFVAATLAIEGYTHLTKTSTYIASLFIMPYTTLIISGSVIVLTCIPGFILISWRILSVRPIEIFKER